VATDEVAPDTLLDSAIEIVQNAKFDSKSFERYQIVSQRLNQYLAKSQGTKGDIFSPVPINLRRLLGRGLKPEQFEQLDRQAFDLTDMLHLETCFLNQGIVKHIAANARGDRAVAEAIFDWVIRNIQVLPIAELPQYRVVPRVSLLLGMCSEQERAWIFMDLLRQAGIDSVFLSTVEQGADAKTDGYSPWAPAAFIDDELYVFDTLLGLPVPGPGGNGIATLRELLLDRSLLKGLEPDAEHPYRVRPEQLDRLIVLFESSPLYYTPRMSFLQSRLSGGNRAILWSDMVQLIGRVTEYLGEETTLDLWRMPAAVHYNNLRNREYVDQISKMMAHIAVPIPMAEIAMESRIAHLRGNLDEAIKGYLMTRNPLPSYLSANEQIVELHGWIREDSTYFLGLAKFEQRELETAATWLGKSYLEKHATGRWVSSARYNLGRCAEARNDAALAIESYTAESTSPQAAGNLVRARRLGWKGPDAVGSPAPAIPHGGKLP